MFRWARAAAVAVAVLVLASAAWSPSAWAKGLPIDAFVGHFVGSGIAKSRSADVLNLKKRDFDVTIAKQDDGFSVAWTTVIRRAGIEEVKRSSTEMSFKPAGMDGFFKSVKRTDPAGRLGYGWASIEDKTLTVYLLVVDADTGAYDLHSYARAVTGPNMMHLKFNRIRKGRPEVIVEGDMTRK